MSRWLNSGRFPSSPPTNSAENHKSAAVFTLCSLPSSMLGRSWKNSVF
jgi:hypothetical protein